MFIYINNFDLLQCETYNKQWCITYTEHTIQDTELTLNSIKKYRKTLKLISYCLVQVCLMRLLFNDDLISYLYNYDLHLSSINDDLMSYLYNYDLHLSSIASTAELLQYDNC